MNPAHLAVHVARHAPLLVHHLVHFGIRTVGEVRQARRAQQEHSMGEHLAARYPFIEKAAEELRRSEPYLTKEQAIAKATLLDQAIKRQPRVSAEAKQLADMLGPDLPADVRRSSFFK